MGDWYACFTNEATMALIVVMEDDETLQLLITSVLKKSGYDVMAAANGQAGLDLVRKYNPDVVISDVQMPILDGFGMLSQLREESAIASTPVILLTSLGERAHMRIGMTAGADDYLVKPFRANEICDAVKTQLNKRDVEKKLQSSAVDAALDAQKNTLTKRYEKRLFEELNGRWSSSLNNDDDFVYANATVLFVELLSSGLSEHLTASEMTDVLKRAYRSASDTINLFSARHIQLVGMGLLAIFVDLETNQPTTHGLRALRSAQGLVDSVGQIDLHLRNKFAERELPRFEVNVVVHSGGVTIAKMSDPLSGNPPLLFAVGETVNLTQLLHNQVQGYGWQVTVSQQAIESLPNPPKTGRSAKVQLRRKSKPMDVSELIGLTQ